ncbi:MAG: hypothetical protein S4CHLAM20_13120 [Chlamydiia bacterium]|nr:hypothetical protein [Chlamydiia bacterium]
MKFSIALCLFLSLNSLFGAKIGIVGWRRQHRYLKYYLYNKLIISGHEVDYLWDKSDFEPYDVIFACNFKSFLEPFKHKVIMTCFEPEVIIPEHADFDRLRGYISVLTWNHDICSQKGFDKFYYPTKHVRHEDSSSMLPFQERKLACMINSYLVRWDPKELYSIRRNIVKFYKRYHPDDFSLYGKRGWNWGYEPVFKGFAKKKSPILRKHKFNFCFENWDNDFHYVSEKLFQSFNDLCVPIYLGSSRVTDLIPKETFIDARKFKSLKELHEFINSMDESTYQTYIDAIVTFSQSGKIYKYTKDYQERQLFTIMNKYLDQSKKH